MLTFMWHELYPEAHPSWLAHTGIASAGKVACAMSAETCAAQLDGLLGSGRRIGLAHESPDVVLTFDDGGRSHRDLAVELLRARGLRAHFFVCTALLGRPGFLAPGDVRALAAAGHAIGSHGRTHVPLTRLSDAALREELTQSRAALEQLLGAPCTTLALPFGACSGPVLAASREAGYQTVFTSALPTGARGPVLGRYSVRASWSPALLRALARGERLAGAYVRGRNAGEALLHHLQQRLRPRPHSTPQPQG